MDLVSDRGRRVTVEELNTSRLLAHATKQANNISDSDFPLFGGLAQAAPRSTQSPLLASVDHAP